MKQSRRNMLQLLGVGMASTLAGCYFSGEHAPVVIKNNSATRRLVSISITSGVESPGFNEYVSDSFSVSPDEEETIDEGLPETDYEPKPTALVTLGDETTKKQQFRRSFELEELRITITESGAIEIDPRER